VDSSCKHSGLRNGTPGIYNEAALIFAITVLAPHRITEEEGYSFQLLRGKSIKWK
jgi:hypothetical protein